MKKRSFWMGASALTLGALACQPLFVVGWREGALIFLLIVFLFGPPVYRFLRRLEKARRKE